MTTNFTNEDPVNYNNDYHHWRECHEAIDNCISEAYLKIKTFEDLEELSQDLMRVADRYAFTGAKPFIQGMVHNVQNSKLSIEEIFPAAIDEMNEKIERKIMERKRAAKRGLMEQVEVESYPPFEIHREPWGDEVYFGGKRIYCDIEDLSDVDKHFTKSSISPKCKKLLVAFVRTKEHILPTLEIQSKLAVQPKTAENVVSDLRAVLDSFKRQTGYELKIDSRKNDREYDYYKLVYRKTSNN